MSASARGPRLTTNAQLWNYIKKAWGPITILQKSPYLWEIQTLYLPRLIARENSRRKTLFEAANVKPPLIPFDFPPDGSKWRSRKFGIRHVLSRNWGEQILYFQGRKPAEPWRESHSEQKRCSLEEWLEYQETAKQVEP